MTPDAILQQMKLLQQQLQRKEIDQATHDQRLVELLQAREAAAVAEPSAQPSTAVPAYTAGGTPPGGPFPPPPSGYAGRPCAGLQVGNYRLETSLGRGGMGEVWKAADLVGERLVVLKFLIPEFLHNDSEMARVKQTFQRVQALHHQHICPILQLGQDAQLGYFVVMKYVDGQTLSEYQASGQPCSLAILVGLLGPVADALDYAHSHRIIHRDIKPSNLMVGAGGKDVQVIDFGLAAEVRTSATRISRVRMDTAGTYPYMAPEQWRGQFQDGKTDQYALGVVAYELLAGRPPFEAPDSTILARIVIEEPVPPLADQPPHVNAALVRALAKQREERFGSCRDFVAALAQPPRDPVEEDVQAGIAEVDKVIAGFPTSPGAARLTQVCEAIEIAISHGAPVYNQGLRDPARKTAYFGACARIYLHTTQRLLAWLEGTRPTAPAEPTPELDLAQSALVRAVAEYQNVTADNAEPFAWALRSAFDLSVFVDELGRAFAALRNSGRRLDLDLLRQVAHAVLERAAGLIQTRSLTRCAELLLYTARGLLRLAQGTRTQAGSSALGQAVANALSGLGTLVNNHARVTNDNVVSLTQDLLHEFHGLAEPGRAADEEQPEEPPAATSREELEKELRHAQGILDARQQRLRVVEIQQARAGQSAPAELTIELADLRAEIARLQDHIKELQRQLPRRR